MFLLRQRWGRKKRQWYNSPRPSDRRFRKPLPNTGENLDDVRELPPEGLRQFRGVRPLRTDGVSRSLTAMARYPSSLIPHRPQPSARNRPQLRTARAVRVSRETPAQERRFALSCGNPPWVSLAGVRRLSAGGKRRRPFFLCVFAVRPRRDRVRRERRRRLHSG